MPLRLLDRCGPDTIREFRAAARLRFDDGLALAASARRTAAIYLWGYAAEMTLKAAYFAVIGMAETDVLTWKGHIWPAIQKGQSMGIAWPSQGAGHNVRAWGQLLIAERASTPGLAFAPQFRVLVLRYSQRLEQLWRETLRYHKNVAYPHEMRQVRQAAEWFLVNSHVL